jgi:hypothetical protein
MCKQILLLPEEQHKKYATRIKYVLLMCEKCYSTWGCSPSVDNKINESDLVCRRCAGEYLYDQMNK